MKSEQWDQQEMRRRKVRQRSKVFYRFSFLLFFRFCGNCQPGCDEL